MALIIGGGITLGGNINLTTYTPVLSGPIFSYNMGNSVSFNGQGVDFSYGNFSGTYSGQYNTNFIFDIAADYANNSYGNIGVYYNDDLGNAPPPGPNSTFPPGNTFVNHGPLSYLAFNGLNSAGSPGTGQYVATNLVNGDVIPAGSSYTLFSVLRVNNFGVPTNVSTCTGGIVAGAEIAFGFLPPGIINVNQLYPILVAGNNGPGVGDITTQFQPNTWYAVSVTYDADSQVMKIYVNGVNTATFTGVAPTANPDSLFWGTWEGGNWLNGDLGVMTAWSRALSPREIASYTTTYGNPYGVASSRQDNDMPTQTYSQLYSEPGEYTFTVPAGVTSISMVGVGAGGPGSLSGYSQPGGDTYVYAQWGYAASGMIPNQTGTNTNIITFDGTYGDNPNILGNVAPGWLVISPALNDTYPNVAIISGNVYAVVDSIDTSNISNIVVTLNKAVGSYTSGVTNFYFEGQGILGAQGGLEADGIYTNGSTGPGPRAQVLIGTGGGRGGVEDYFDNDALGGGGAGGYGTSAAIVAFDPNQTYLYNGNGNINTGVPQTVVGLSNNNLTATAIGNSVNGYTTTGTYPIGPTEKVMFSITLTTWSGSSDTMAVGLGNYDANISGVLGADANSIGYSDVGNVLYNGSWIATGLPTFQSTGKIIDIAVDRSVDAMWVRIDGGDWNGNVSADPATNLGGIEIMQGTPNDPNLYLMLNVGFDTNLGAMSINTSNTYPIPSGYTFISGSPNAGSTGGDGAKYELPTNKDGQGAGGSGGGGGGICYDTGTGGGGTGLYGVGSAGVRGGWLNDNDFNSGDNTLMAAGASGGSTLGNSGTTGGIASLWAGGAGGWPGGGGGSGTDYYGGGNGGALAYVNNITVTPGQQFQILVGQGGYGSGTSSHDYYSAGVGAGGAIRIVWPGDTRQFPSTNAGVDPTGPSSITIGTSDFVYGGGVGQMGVTSVGGYVTGLTSNGGSNIIDSYANMYNLSNNTLAQDITAMFRQARMTTHNTLNYIGATPNPYVFNAYIFNVIWADNSTGLVRMSWTMYGQINISVIDTAYTDWETASPGTQYGGNTNPVKAGTFNFPATFTPVIPLIESSGDAWC